MSFRNSQLKSKVHHDGGYISDSVLVTRRHQKNQRSHVTFSDDNNNDVSEIHDTSRHRGAHFYTEDINDEAEKFIRLKHNQMSVDYN